MNSYNHYALGAVFGFFYRRLAGIAPAAPGFRRIAIRPIWLPKVGKVSAKYESCVGTIATEVDGDAGGVSHLTLSIPANAVAEVEIGEHTSELQSLMRISYAVFCLKKKKQTQSKEIKRIQMSEKVIQAHKVY